MNNKEFITIVFIANMLGFIVLGYVMARILMFEEKQLAKRYNDLVEMELKAACYRSSYPHAEITRNENGLVTTNCYTE